VFFPKHPPSLYASDWLRRVDFITRQRGETIKTKEDSIEQVFSPLGVWNIMELDMRCAVVVVFKRDRRLLV
jgi:hypothetical protein